MSNEVTIVVTAKSTADPVLKATQAQAKATGEEVAKVGDKSAPPLDKATGASTRFGASIKRVGEIAAGVLTAELLTKGAEKAKEYFTSAVEASSSLGESLNAVQKIFKSSSSEVLDWGKANANAFGLSQRAFNESAVPLGAMLKNNGIAMKDVAQDTIDLTKRASDLASVFNTDVADALDAIKAGLRGESDPLERYGVSLSAAAVDAQAMADSGKANAAQLSNQERMTARLKIIFDQTADSAGDFASTTNGLANSQRVANAQIEDAKAKLGQQLLPVMAMGAQVVGKLAEGFGMLPGPVANGIVAIAGIGVAIGLLGPKLVAAKASMVELGIAQKASAFASSQLGGSLLKVAGGLAIINATGHAVSSVLHKDLNPQVDALTGSLEEMAATGKLSGEGLRVFGDHAQDLDKSLTLASSRGFDAALNKFDEVTTSIVGLDGELYDSKTRVDAFDQALAAMAADGRGKDALALVNLEAARTGRSVADLKGILPQYSAAVEVAARKSGDMGDATVSLSQGLDRFGHVVHYSAISVDDLTKSIDDYLGSALSMEEAQDRIAQDVADLTEQIKKQKTDGDKNAGSLIGQSQAARDNRDSIRGLLEDYGKLIEQYRDTNQSTAALRAQFVAQARQAGLTGAAIDAYAAKLFDVPAVKTTEIRLLGVDAAIQGIDAVKYEIAHKLPSQVHGQFDSYAHGGITGATGMYGTAATGGARGGLTWVGEQGPELARLPYGSTVYSHGQSMAMAASGALGGGPAEVHITIDLLGADEDLRKRIQKMTDVHGGGNVQLTFGKARAAT